MRHTYGDRLTLVFASSIDLDEVNESTLPEVRSPTTLLKFDPSDVIRNIELAILSFASDSEVRRYFLDFTTFENRPFEFKSRETITSNANKTLFS